jgi:hypothetical protein
MFSPGVLGLATSLQARPQSTLEETFGIGDAVDVAFGARAQAGVGFATRLTAADSEITRKITVEKMCRDEL